MMMMHFLECVESSSIHKEIPVSKKPIIRLAFSLRAIQKPQTVILDGILQLTPIFKKLKGECGETHSDLITIDF